MECAACNYSELWIRWSRGLGMNHSGGLTVSVLRFSVNVTFKALAQCWILGLVILHLEQLLSGARTSWNCCLSMESIGQPSLPASPCVRAGMGNLSWQDGLQAVADALLGHSYSTSIPLYVGSLHGDTGFLNTYSKTLFIQRIHTYSYWVYS